MSSGSWNVEIPSTVSADRLFKAAMLDWHTLGPKAAPEVIASSTVLSGQGEVGSIREIKFTPVVPVAFIKERLDFADLDNFEVKSSLIGGGHIGVSLESSTSHFKFEPSSDGGCVVKVEVTYKLLPNVNPDESVIALAKENVVGHIKAAEAYLIANPTEYL